MNCFLMFSINDIFYYFKNISSLSSPSLGSIDGLKVISRTSSDLYKNTKKSIIQIGKELKVDQILEGTLKIEKDRVWVNVKLSETRRGFNIWSQSYDKKLEKSFLKFQECSFPTGRNVSGPPQRQPI